eukprot:1967494-Alexandrium_andersonii.AAC.1
MLEPKPRNRRKPSLAPRHGGARAQDPLGCTAAGFPSLGQRRGGLRGRESPVDQDDAALESPSDRSEAEAVHVLAGTRQ